jgi:uncharacterized membrane protein YagU involved in acid resistance
MSTGNLTPVTLGIKDWLLVLLLVFAVILSSFTYVDDYAETDLDSLFQRALITFALARTLNGVISAVQGTEVALQPAGVGITLTPGEILDPVNDLVERFSWIMLGATISLGIQQVLLEAGQWWVLRVVLVVLSLTWLGIRIWRKKSDAINSKNFDAFLLYALLVTIFIRFAVPLALIANEGIYRLFLESRYLESSQELETAGEALEQVRASGNDNVETDVDAGNSSLISRLLSSAKESLDFENQLETFKKRTSELIGHLVQLSVVFILQTGIFPIVFLWILLSLLKFIFRFGLVRRLNC